MLSLPSRWVFVYYEDGKTENVANTDTLSTDEARAYKERWEKARNKRVIRVELQDSKGNLLKSFSY